MDHTATISCTYDSTEIASVIHDAIVIETKTITGDRATATISQNKATVVIKIDARDPRALRAAKHTWFSLLKAAEKTSDAVSAG
ncbi:KEOPS complex Pcc1-like subunit [Salinarchaeum sp. IM2453]|uniref:KEOPS complex subunit Pcc1 n=1 Tax=Salinarchaeum sp. IM2453 TaxID=2862870 RepID=UPI001C835F0C|nr:KEOPS complex subunit Pcc1 [Salinarchaeum sp. IM2453]QZA89174.1 KEOPS complex Pcc1-like subunit [Salinarchaeum sp. IM2453]